MTATAVEETPQQAPPEGRVRLLISLLLILTLAIGLATPDFFVVGSWNTPALVALGLGFAISERLIFHVEARTEAVSYSPSDIVLGLGLVFVDPLALILVRVIGTSVANVLWRRTAPLKWAFNMTNFTFETALAVGLLHRMPFDAGEPSMPLWLGLLASLFVALVAGGLAVAGVISCFEGDFAGRARRELAQSPVTHLPGATVAAAVAVSMLVEVWLGLVIATVAPIVWWVVRSHGALQHQFDDLSSVHRFSSEVGHDEDTASILERGATQIAENLRAESVAVRVWGTNNELTDFSAGAADLTDRLPALPPEGPLDWDIDDGIIVPFGDDRGTLGVIALAGRRGVSNHFDDADRSRLATMVGQLVVAVRKSQLYAQIQYDATHDRLTGLANRGFFEAWVDEATSSTGHYGTVLFIDLDRFKEINDAFGHETGDRLLAACSSRIKSAVPADALVARFGGDEFAVYVPNHTLADSRKLAENLTKTLDEPFALTEASVAVTSSIGIVSTPTHGRKASVLLRRADIAMYDAKRRFNRWSCFDSGLDEDDAVRISMIADLRHAISEDELDVHYQPKIDISTGDVVAAEALVRWTHPEHGPVRPDVFVELAEQSGMIEPLTDIVMGKATAAAARWQRRGWNIAVAVNISAQSLLDERLLDMVARHLDATGLGADLLTLEITESTMMGDPERTERMLHGLTSMGVEISVDDFGTGFSSLSSLRQLPVAELKIDRGFVSAMDSNHHDAVIVRSTIDLAHNLGLRIVAEGVETVEVLRELGSLDCDLAQGFGISRPLPLLQFDEWINFRTSNGLGPTWQWESSGLLGDDLGPSLNGSTRIDQIESNAANNSSNAVN